MDEVGQVDDNAVASDEQLIIGGTTDTGDACVVAVFAHAPEATGRERRRRDVVGFGQLADVGMLRRGFHVRVGADTTFINNNTF